MSGFLGGHLRGVDEDVRLKGRLVGAIDAREVLELARARLFVEPLDIARLGNGQRRVNEYLKELALDSDTLAALEDLVRRRARFRCEYCLLPEALVSTPLMALNKCRPYIR